MRRRMTWMLMLSVAAALTASAAMASVASASPVWRFNGTELSGSETVVAETAASTLTLPGLATTCKASITMTISNSGGKGTASVTSMSLSGCSTNGVCTVKSATASGTPWTGSTEIVGENSYLVVQGFSNKILYGGEECAIEGLTINYRGSVGGLFNNSNSKLIFNEASATATGTSLKSIGETKTGYDAEYEVKATGSHAGQALTLS
jgi:hypothetical protein